MGISLEMPKNWVEFSLGLMPASDIALRVFGVAVIIAACFVPRAARRVFIHAIWIYALLALVSLACVIALIRCVTDQPSHCSVLQLCALVAGAVVSAWLPGFAAYTFVVHIREERALARHYSQQRTVATVSADVPLCPKCSRHMIRRRASRGRHAGQHFWGCSAYPSCRGIRDDHATKT